MDLNQRVKDAVLMEVESQIQIIVDEEVARAQHQVQQRCAQLAHFVSAKIVSGMQISQPHGPFGNNKLKLEITFDVPA